MANGSQRIHDKRGNSRDRARRRAWIVFSFSVDGVLRCCRCHEPIVGEWHVDRFPIAGHQGGRYVRGNIAPAHPQCNLDHHDAAELIVGSPMDRASI